jgi:hypothetical protein
MTASAPKVPFQPVLAATTCFCTSKSNFRVRRNSGIIAQVMCLDSVTCTGFTRPCPAREIIITDAISKAEEIMRKIGKNYPPR